MTIPTTKLHNTSDPATGLAFDALKRGTPLAFIDSKGDHGGGTALALKPHGIPRDEWVRRFKAALIAQACLDAAGADDNIVAAELTSWPEQDEQPVAGFDAEWMTELPESAAAENLSNWTE